MVLLLSLVLNMLYLIVTVLLSVYAQFISPSSIVKNKSDVSSIFEGLGYSPVCIASALASCERFAKPDCYLHVLYLMPELKNLLEGIKCDNKRIPATEDPNKVDETLKLDLSEQFNSFSNILLQNMTNILERHVTNNTIALDNITIILNGLKTEHLEQNGAIKEFRENLTDFRTDLHPSKESMESNKRAKNCAEASLPGGVTTVYPYEENISKAVEVFCDQTTDGGGWTVIQNRDALTVRENFYRTWSEYANGFGNLIGEFWLGLDNIHALTNSAQMELRIDLEDYDGVKKWAKYDSFKIGDASSKYVLTLGKYSGDAGDSFSYHNGMKFSTYDQDNEKDKRNCAKLYKGGWWYKGCHLSNLNGYQHVGKDSPSAEGIFWYHFRGNNYYSLKKANMKVRSKSRD